MPGDGSVSGSPRACKECGTTGRRAPLRDFEARALHADRWGKLPTFTVTICDSCLARRGAAWRYAFTVTGRTLPASPEAPTVEIATVDP